MRFSEKQTTIFEAVQSSDSNICIKATAGAGKTTTLLHCLTLVPRTVKSIFVAFNKSIVEELRGRVPSYIKTSTLHSLGFLYIRNYFAVGKFMKTITVDEDKYFKKAIKIIEKQKPSGSGPLNKEDFKSAYRIQDIVAFARMTMTPQTFEALSVMCNYYTIEFTPELIEIAIELLKSSLARPSVIDFTDMIWYPSMIKEMITDKYECIFLDEAQDLNQCQFNFVEALIGKGGRLIAVGDPFQSIYSFAGTDIYSFQRIMERANTITLPLNRTYRCPKLVVKKAREVCEEIEAFDGAEEGRVVVGSFDEIEDGDMVVSRTTKPLIALYFLLIEFDIKAQIVGKDIETGLITLAESCSSKSKEGVIYNIQAKLKKLQDELVHSGITKPTEHVRYRTLDEKMQVITLILGKVNEAKELVSKIHEIFKEDRQAAKLMTIHRSKGLECDRVFVIDTFNHTKTMPSKWASQDWELIQEKNLQFVAFTRAKKELIFINVNE